ncbi:galactose oxidase [Mucilaginibacter sp. X5P1]|uniref:galactose oxidase n=1 Tax=Mucilaginibacter sp. X5P1 TaxID=2723088 RepID=UPI00160C53BF|nr:galactose oxidase [Mucilaginibacter sp. X5P1]MBB6140359.1 hypothetical protein [Mucilaginibacter sp. X5P1]
MRLGCKIFKIVFCFLCVLLIFRSEGYGQSYGLAFSSHEVFQDKRTSLDLSPDKTLCFNDNFDISFDISFIPNHAVYFGYIIRIIADDNRNIDLVYVDTTKGKGKHFNVIIGDRLSKVAFNISRDKLFGQWNKLSIKFDFDHDRILFYNGQTVFIENGMHLKKNSCYKVLFGINNYKEFQTTDTPPMKIRDIRVTENNQLKYNWPLNEVSGLVAHEIISQNDASVANPMWVTAMHRDWQKVQGVTVNGLASVAFDPKKEEVYLIASDSLYTYSVNTEKWQDKGYHGGDKIILNQGNQSIFNQFNQTLYNFFPNQRFAANYNFKSDLWNRKFSPNHITDLWHLNKFFSKADTTLYFLGGYGHLVYKNKVQQYHLNSGTWNDVKTTGDFFMPRYLAGLGTTANGDTAYILGGYGNSSGQQILNPRNIYDMMRFTVKDKAFKKLFELKVNDQDFAFANSLVIDDHTKTYYGLIFPQHKYNSTLQLIKGSLAKPDYTLMGSAIPYSFHDTHSFADLYYCPASKRFIAVTLLRKDNGQTEVKIYTLQGPPYGISTLPAIVKSKVQWYIISGIIVLGIVLLLYIYRYKRKRKTVTTVAVNQPENPAVSKSAATVPIDIAVSNMWVFDPKLHVRNTILLFGEFQVFDAEGVDITKYFTPLIKELFLIILLYSLRWGRGLSSEKLNEILWYDKSAKDAGNNRSVSIGKLKNLLDKMGYCHLSKDTGYWKVDIDHDHIYIDYYNYLNIVNDKEELDIKKIKYLSEITKRGNFLSDIEYEWLDFFKSEISNVVIDTYLNFAHSGRTHDPEFMVELANFIFYFDPVNEEAMVIKCKALAALGKHSLAKKAFDTFVKDYREIYGEDFKKDFNSVLG